MCNVPKERRNSKMLVTSVSFSNNSRSQKINTKPAITNFQASYDTVSFKGAKVKQPSAITKFLNAVLPDGRGKYVRPVTNVKGVPVGHIYQKDNVFTTYNLNNQKISALKKIDSGSVMEEFCPETQRLKKRVLMYKNKDVEIIKYNSEGQRVKELSKKKMDNGKFQLELVKYDSNQYVIERIKRTQKTKKIDGKTYNITAKSKFTPDGMLIEKSIRGGNSYRKVAENIETNERETFERKANGNFSRKKYKDGNLILSKEKKGKNYTLKKFNPENPQEMTMVIRLTPTGLYNGKTNKPLYRLVKKEKDLKHPAEMTVTTKRTGEKVSQIYNTHLDIK